MLWIERIRTVKVWLVIIAVVIAIASLVTSHFLIRDLQAEETKSVEVWAEAMRSLNMADENTDLNLVLKVINGNNKIPVVVLDKEGNVQTFRNVDIKEDNYNDTLIFVKQIAASMKEDGRSILIYLDVDGGSESEMSFDADSAVDVADVNSDMLYQQEDVSSDYIEICYDESIILKRLAWYPYIQLAVVVVFVIIAFFALFASMKAEQNRVWVGLSKETAHQLGTPISSLMAWSEVLRETYPDDELLPEMEKDILRLERIADRFSKIGSIPEPKKEDLCEILLRVVDYMDHRTSNKVTITTHFSTSSVELMIIAPLFEWVTENLCKNAVDAMGGCGSIDVYLSEGENRILVDFADTGKGIAKKNFKDVFKPGFTTKTRGWGLGLSLAKRIVEDYHNGRIYVKSSELGKGTTFRIELPYS